MKKAYLSLFLTTILMSIAVLSYSQNKAQIQIRKNQNGVKSEETREIELSDGQKIQDILMEMGVLDELGQLKEGQEIEIRIDKTDKNQDFENLEFLFD